LPSKARYAKLAALWARGDDGGAAGGDAACPHDLTPAGQKILAANGFSPVTLTDDR
jgi:hypothetical protein